jgi:hypothetical protein
MPKACGLVARLVERVLVFQINPDATERHSRDFPQFPAHAAPIDAAHDDGKVFIAADQHPPAAV